MHKLLLTDLPRLERGPLEPLDVEGHASENTKDDDGLKTDLLSLIMLGLGSPVEESSHVFGHLGCGAARAFELFPKLVSGLLLMALQNPPSGYSTRPSYRTRAIAMAPPGK